MAIDCQMTGGEGLWRRRSLASVGNTTSRVNLVFVTAFMLFPRPRDNPQLLSSYLNSRRTILQLIL